MPTPNHTTGLLEHVRDVAHRRPGAVLLGGLTAGMVIGGLAEHTRRAGTGHTAGTAGRTIDDDLASLTGVPAPGSDHDEAAAVRRDWAVGLAAKDVASFEDALGEVFDPDDLTPRVGHVRGENVGNLAWIESSIRRGSM